MNKLIKYFNTNYGKEYGKIAYPRTTLQIYRTYQAIKSYGINDEKLVELLHNIKLPRPMTIEEKELYTDCLYNRDDGELTTREYVDKKINSIPVGSPTQEQVDTWLNAHPEATTTVQDGSITPQKTTFIKTFTPKNFINLDKVQLHKKQNVENGSLEDNDNYNTTDFIDVSNMQNYYIYFKYDGAYFIAYNDKKEFQSVTTNINLASAKTIASWMNAKYIRVSYESTVANVEATNPDLRITENLPSVFPEYEKWFKEYNEFQNITTKSMNDDRLYIGKKVTNVNVEEHTIAIGENSTKVTQNSAVAIGYGAMQNLQEASYDKDSGKFNTCVGNHSMNSLTTGDHNTAVGWASMGLNTTGSFNTAVGEDALLTNTSGNGNSCFGNRAYQLGEGSFNTVIGTNAMFTSDNNASHPTGNNNTSIGSESGVDRGTGSDNVAIGFAAKINENINHSCAIGSGAKCTKDNQFVFGGDWIKYDYIFFGDITICGSDNIYRKLIFNPDGSISWINVNEDNTL